MVVVMAFLLRLDLFRLVEWGLESIPVSRWLLIEVFYLSISRRLAALIPTRLHMHWGVLRRGFVLWRVEFLGEEGLEDAGNEAFDGIEDFSLRHHALPFGTIESRRAG